MDPFRGPPQVEGGLVTNIPRVPGTVPSAQPPVSLTKVPLACTVREEDCTASSPHGRLQSTKCSNAGLLPDNSNPPGPPAFPKTKVEVPCSPAPTGLTSRAEASFLQEALLALRAGQAGCRLRLPKPSQAGDCGWGRWLGCTKSCGPWGGVGCTHIVQLVVEATGVAHRVPVGVPAP